LLASSSSICHSCTEKSPLRCAAKRPSEPGALGTQGCRLRRRPRDKLAQKLGQLQPFITVFPQECMGQLPSFGST
jgi:hypothetical protein